MALEFRVRQFQEMGATMIHDCVRTICGSEENGPCACSCHDTPEGATVSHVVACCPYSCMPRAEAEQKAIRIKAELASKEPKN